MLSLITAPVRFVGRQVARGVKATRKALGEAFDTTTLGCTPYGSAHAAELGLRELLDELSAAGFTPEADVNLRDRNCLFDLYSNLKTASRLLRDEDEAKADLLDEAAEVARYLCAQLGRLGLGNA